MACLTLSVLSILWQGFFDELASDGSISSYAAESLTYLAALLYGSLMITIFLLAMGTSPDVKRKSLKW